MNWGLLPSELTTLPPTSSFSFSRNGDPTTSFGSDMGPLPLSDPPLQMGAKLMRGSWNAQVYGDLWEVQQEGLRQGTDYVFHKNRLSGLSGSQVPFEAWLEENKTRTLFFGGVNTDQCVWGTLLDAAYKSYDTILVQDLSASTSPSSATEMTNYNSNLLGWMTSSSLILDGLR